jgi:hypothetical protein
MAIRCSRSSLCSDASNLALKSRLKNSKLYCYIGSTRPRSAITNYNTLARCDMVLYFSRWMLISFSFCSPFMTLSLTSIDFTLASSRLLIRPSSSKMSAPAELTCCRIFSSASLSPLRCLSRSTISLSFSLSNSGFSYLTTSTNSWSSRPFGVTVEVKIVALMRTSVI